MVQRHDARQSADLAIVLHIAIVIGLAPPVSAQSLGEFAIESAPVPQPVTVVTRASDRLRVGDNVVLVGSDADETIAGQAVPSPNPQGLADDRSLAVAAVLPSVANNNRQRKFEIRRSHDDGDQGRAATSEGFLWRDNNDTSLELRQDGVPVLVYNHGVITRQDLPESEYRRSRGCYIHPLYGLRQEVLTDDFPKDHYHHHGVFWTWPRVGYNGRDYDLWIGEGIEQRFVRWITRASGPVAAVLAVENGWFLEDGRQIMTERVWVRAFRDVKNSRSIDLNLFWIPTDGPVQLQGAAGKSYGGLTVRFRAPSWKEDADIRITVPTGVTTSDLPDTPLPWADFSSQFGEDNMLSGGAIFIPGDHPDYPPTWLTRHYGPLCVGWPGVHAREFEPHKTIALGYRLWLHDGEADVASLQRQYAAFLAASRVKVLQSDAAATSQ